MQNVAHQSQLLLIMVHGPECGNQNSGKFCANCGTKKPEKPKKIKCDKCGYEPDMSGPIPKFCPNCGDPINEGDMI